MVGMFFREINGFCHQIKIYIPGMKDMISIRSRLRCGTKLVSYIDVVKNDNDFGICSNLETLLRRWFKLTDIHIYLWRIV